MQLYSLVQLAKKIVKHETDITNLTVILLVFWIVSNRVAANVQRLAAGRQNKELFRLSPTTNSFYLWAKPA